MSPPRGLGRLAEQIKSVRGGQGAHQRRFSASQYHDTLIHSMHPSAAVAGPQVLTVQNSHRHAKVKELGLSVQLIPRLAYVAYAAPRLTAVGGLSQVRLEARWGCLGPFRARLLARGRRPS